jgi:hypothetical protein
MDKPVGKTAAVCREDHKEQAGKCAETSVTASAAA